MCLPWIVWSRNKKGLAGFGETEHENLVSRGGSGGQDELSRIDLDLVAS